MEHLTLIDYICLGWVSIGLILTVIAIIRDSRIQKKIQNSIYNHYQNNDMDYEQKYKEALDWARKVYPHTCGKEKEDLERVFPELNESEDERMIKWLHYLIEIAYTTDLTWDIPKEDVLAYLEKQKEQEPINECNTHEPTLEEAREWNEAYEKGYSLGYENGRNEQKPAEWSEEDELNKETAIRFLNTFAYGSDLFDENGEIKSHDLRSCINWLKSLRPKPHWKPSKEQMEELYTAARETPITKEDGNYLYDLYYDLKKLM